MKYFYLRIILLFVLLQISYVLSAQSINWKNIKSLHKTKIYSTFVSKTV